MALILTMIVGFVVIAGAIFLHAGILADRAPDPDNVHIIMQKDPDMATVFQRLAAIDSKLSDIAAQVSSHSDASGSFATVDALNAVSVEVDELKSVIGSDDEPTTPVSTPVDTTPVDTAPVSTDPTSTDTSTVTATGLDGSTTTSTTPSF